MKPSPNNIDLIAVDLDGTLLNSALLVSDRTLQVVQRAYQAGINFVLVSARPPFGMVHVLDRLAIDLHLVAYNGAYVTSSNLDEVLLERPMATADAQNAIRIIREYGLYTGYYVAMQWYVEKECEEMHFERRALNYEPLVTDLAQLTDLNPHKLIVIDLNDSSRLEAGYQAFRSTLPHLSVHYSGQVSFEVNDRRATKASALAFLAKKMNIAPKAILAIGDNFNDMDMFKFAGTSVAMGNAPPEVQASADLVVASNDQDGVAQAINRLLS